MADHRSAAAVAVAAAAISKTRLSACFSSPFSLRIKESLEACSNAFATGDFSTSDAAVASVVGLLDSIVADSEAAAQPTDAAAAEALLEIHRFLTSSSSDQLVIDALALELPKVVARFAPLSDRCREIVGSIIDCLVSLCGPRDMISVLCEALDTYISILQARVIYIPLLTGLSKVFLCIQRHHVKQIKIALIIVLRVLKAISLGYEEEDKDSLNDIFGASIAIANSIQVTSEKMIDRSKDELCAMLGLYVLENIALVSRSRQSHVVSSCNALIVQLSKFIPFCGLTYLGLITGCDNATITSRISKEDGDEFMESFSLTRDGASLAVIWGYISDEVAKAASEQLTVVLDNIRNNHIKRWQAVGMLRHGLSSIDYPWEIKSYCVELLSSMMDGSKYIVSNDSNEDFSSFIPTLFAALQAIQRFVMGTSDAKLRRKAFDVLKKVVTDIPSSERFDMLKALITNSNSPSMTAILFDIVKEEILMENRHRGSVINNETSPFWSSDALELVELVLKPPKGGPPSLPENTEPVLAALNLYRFILMMESAGKTNYTGVLSEKMLRKAYSDWLLPLRTLVSGIQVETEKDSGELAEGILCGLNPVQLVLYRCIELVEEKLTHFK